MVCSPIESARWIAGERGREQFGGARRADVDEDDRWQRDSAVACVRVEHFALYPFGFAHGERALRDKQARQGEPAVQRSARCAPDVDDQTRCAVLRELRQLRFLV